VTGGGPLPLRPGRFPVAALIALQLLAFPLPNLLLQLRHRDAPLLPLLAVQAFNAALIVLVPFLFRTPRAARWVMVPLAALSFCTLDFLFHFGGMPSTGTYLSLAGTSAREVLEYLIIKKQALLLLALAVALYALAYSRLAARCEGAALARARKPVLALCLGAVACFLGWDALSFDPGRPEPAAAPLPSSFPAGFVLSAERAYAYCRGLQRRVDGFQFHAYRPAPVADRETYVLVIGESAAASHWSLGGYPIDTSARMRKYLASGDLVYFPRTLAQANLTAFALPLIVTPATPADFAGAFRVKSLVSAFREVGFKTYWIENQEETGAMTEADFPIFLHIGSSFQHPSYDQEVLPYLDALLSSPKARKFIVIHLMGSHVEYGARVPPGFPAPGVTGTSQGAQYDRTLCYTDCVLDEIIRRLSGARGRSFLWYVSDHGQILRAGEVGHGSLEATLDELHVPMFVWANRECRAAAPEAFRRLGERRDRVLSQGVTFPTVLGLGGVDYPGLDHGRDLSGPAFDAGRRPQVLNGQARPGRIAAVLEALSRP